MNIPGAQTSASLRVDLRWASKVVADAAGNIYFADTYNNAVRKVTVSTGVITTVAGNGTSGYSGDGALATGAALCSPQGIALDPYGNIYIADYGNNRVRKITIATGIISTVAGNGAYVYWGYMSYTGDGGPATSASLNGPFDIAVDAAGNIYISDTNDDVIRKVSASTGIITTFAAGLYPGTLALDSTGNLYVAMCDRYGIAKYSISTGQETWLSGDFIPGGIAVDAMGNLYAADSSDGVLKKITIATGLSSIITGTAGNGYTGDGGPSASAKFGDISSVAVDSSGNIYIVDDVNQVIRRIDASTGFISTVAGVAAGYAGDGGLATSASLSGPQGAAFDAAGNLYIADTTNMQIRKVSASTGNISTIDTQGVLSYPQQIAVDSVGNLFIQDLWSFYEVAASTGTVSLLNFNNWVSSPSGITVDAAGNVYVADNSNDQIYKYSPSTGAVTVFAGTGNDYGGGDGGPAIEARLDGPYGLVADHFGNIYFLDGCRIRVIYAAGTVPNVSSPVQGYLYTVGGSGYCPSYGITVDQAGNIYVADTWNNVVRKVSASNGYISTVAGTGPAGYGASGYSGDGGPATSAQLNWPSGVTVDQAGNLYIADTNNNIIRKVSTGSTVSTAYDTGAVTLSITGPTGVVSSAQVGYGQSSTPATVAASLVSSFASVSNSPVTVAQNGTPGGLTITALQSGAASNYAYSISSSSNDPSDFGQGGSFGSSATSGTMTGGTNSVLIPTTVYQYSIPTNGGYGSNSNIMSYTDTIMGTWSFGYDSLNRLTTGGSTAGSYNGIFTCWTYDSFGNRLSEAVSATPCPNSPTPTSWANYNSNNQMTATNQLPGGAAPTAASQPGNGMYDSAGNTLVDGVNQYLYDGGGRVCAVAQTGVYGGTMTQYLYNADGVRVAKGTIQSWSCDATTNGFTLTNQYILGPSGEQMTELASSAITSANPSGWIHTNVFAGSGLIATYENDNSGPHFRLTDWLGTTRAQTNYMGELEQTCQTLPFGDGPPCSRATEQLFTGKERDTESGNDYFGARYYASNMGRFMSPDWAAKAEPVPYAKMDDPQSLNLYVYGGNDPLVNVDMDGHDSLFEQAAFCDILCMKDKIPRDSHIIASAPTLPNQQPAPPNIPVPGGKDTGWKWNPDSGNSRGGTWGPEKWDRKTQGNPPSASWDDKPGKNGIEHWDVKHGASGPQTTDRYTQAGGYLTPDQAHGRAGLPKMMAVSLQITMNIFVDAAMAGHALDNQLQHLSDSLHNISPPPFPSSGQSTGGTPPLIPPPMPYWALIP